jgi:hypothetical protein
MSWLTAANFLAYSNNLLVVRTNTAGNRNAVATLTGTITSIPVTDGGAGHLEAPVVTIAAPDTAGGITATAVAIIVGGTVTSIEITNPGSGYTTAPAVTVFPENGTTFGAAVVSQTGIKINNENDYQISWESRTTSLVGEFAAKFPGTLGNSLFVSMADSTTFAAWDYKGNFDSAPGTSEYAASAGSSNDELHIVVVDETGKWTGTPGSVLESFAFASKASDAKKSDGTTAYYKDVLNNQSQYVWWMGHPVNTWGVLADQRPTGSGGFAALGGQLTRTLSGGVNDFVSTLGQKIAAFDLFSNDEEFDVNLIMAGKANATLANYIVQNIAEVRKDCVAFVSPEDASSGSPLIGNSSDITEKLVAYRNLLTSSSYMVIDSGYKYQYDRYNDQYRWVPLNGDVAGLCARTDFTDDPWFSPAGLNRGQIKNVVKLAFSPRKTDRDNLYKSGINPVVSFPGQGVVLYGDKTGLSKPSAFDRINVRRLFITLEKAIATAAKYQLFEFNDSFTRAQFRNIVEPFLRDVKGRRGVTDFRVICDESNNTGEVIDTNRFVADIYIKPARSINFITLNFIATRTGASFTEIAG